MKPTKEQAEWADNLGDKVEDLIHTVDDWSLEVTGLFGDIVDKVSVATQDFLGDVLHRLRTTAESYEPKDTSDVWVKIMDQERKIHRYRRL